MANPYLIQAIYGQKPTAPRVNSNGASEKPPDPRTVTAAVDAKSREHSLELQRPQPLFSRAGVFGSIGDRASTASRPLSLAERLYGSTAAPEPGVREVAHADSIEINTTSDSEDTEDESPVFPRSRAPIGPNMVPATNSPVSCEPIKTIAPAEQLSTFAQPVAARTRLRLPVERYLPPKGAYHDQFGLLDTFPFGFTVNDCSTCWGPKSQCPKANTCIKTCKVCNTKNHPGQTCPSLYCTISWYHDRRIEPYTSWFKGSSKPFELQYVRQFRPSEKEFPVLLQMGLIVGVFRHGAPIVPNTAHPQVKTFYCDQPTQIDVQSKSEPKRAVPNPELDRVALMRSPTPANATLKADVQVKSTLDPRLQGKFAYMTMFKASSPASSESVSSIAPASSAAPVMKSYTEIEEAAEKRIRELEDEVLQLKTESVQKDREIRRLKVENAKLRGMEEQPGQKRQRA